jgi:hypothetical protein
MTVLTDYRHFDGRHPETGSVQNALAYQGAVAPHTGQPLSEAMLMGISGGVAFGYFTFEYSGYDPHVALLTRNTFDPLQTLLERLGVTQTVWQTSNPEKADANLMEVLDSGRPALVWADMFSLPYNLLEYDPKNWAVTPLVVFGHDGHLVHIADRSARPLAVPAAEFARARARVKQRRFQVVSLDPPDMRKLPSAVQKGLWQCIQLYTEAPPRGKKANFGLAGLQHWAKMLTNTRNPQSWARFFPPGRRMWSALAGGGPQPGIVGWVLGWGDGGAERGRYADFLEEAAALLRKPKLRAAADLFRQSQAAWKELAHAALPDRTGPLKQARELISRREQAFIEEGQNALAVIQDINRRLDALKSAASEAFPGGEAEAAAIRAAMSEVVLRIQALEAAAVETVQAAIA